MKKKEPNLKVWFDLLRNKRIEGEYKDIGIDTILMFAKNFLIKPENLPYDIEMYTMTDDEFKAYIDLHTVEELDTIMNKKFKFKVDNFEVIKGEGFYTLAVLMYVFGVTKKDIIRRLNIYDKSIKNKESVKIPDINETKTDELIQKTEETKNTHKNEEQTQEEENNKLIEELKKVIKEVEQPNIEEPKIVEKVEELKEEKTIPKEEIPKPAEIKETKEPKNKKEKVNK